MRKGFTLTLMTVAVAMLGTQAQAMAPTIGDIPSPIIGNDIPVTGGANFSNFVYLDAIDLDTKATDDVTAPSALMWTYSGSGLNGASNYLINGVQPINVGTTDPTSPTTALIINRNDLDPVPGKDSLKNTITIRNKALSPMPSGSAGTDPGATGFVAAQTQPVTFFCSDGNAFSSETVFFYTEKGGNDRLSGGDPFKLVKSDKITTMWNTNPSDWAVGGANGITRVRPSGLPNNGVCLNAPAAGDNTGSVISAMPYFNLASNQVYRFKMTMTNSNLTPGNMPFWDIVLENYETHTGVGLNLYIMDTRIFANEGAGNALTPTASTVTWYWTPPAVSTTQWTSGAFTAANDSVNDPRLRFRVMDYSTGTYPPAQGDLKSGAVCIQELEVSSAAVTAAQTVGTPLVNITSLTKANAGGTGNVEFVPLIAGGSTGTFASGALTVTPAGSGTSIEMPDIIPQAKTGGFSTDPASADAAASFPIAWKTGKILRLQVGMSAPTAADEANPWDAYVFLFNTMTNEINMESYQTSNKAIGSPKVGTPQTYTTFFYTGNETKSTVAGYHRLRWFMRAVNLDTANFPDGIKTTNTGAFRVHNIKVDEVIFK